MHNLIKKIVLPTVLATTIIVPTALSVCPVLNTNSNKTIVNTNRINSAKLTIDWTGGQQACIIDDNDVQHFCTDLVKNRICANSPTIVDDDGNKYDKATFNYQIELNPTLTAIPNDFMIHARAFNQPVVIPTTVISIGNNFLNGCIAFNSTVTYADTANAAIKSIGDYFMGGCKKFNQSIVVPASITDANSIGTNFLRWCDNMVSLVDIKCNMNAFKDSDDSFTASKQNVPAYQNGIQIDFTIWDEFNAKFPSNEKRKCVLFLDGEIKFTAFPSSETNWFATINKSQKIDSPVAVTLEMKSGQTFDVTDSVVWQFGSDEEEYQNEFSIKKSTDDNKYYIYTEGYLEKNRYNIPITATYYNLTLSSELNIEYTYIDWADEYKDKDAVFLNDDGTVYDSITSLSTCGICTTGESRITCDKRDYYKDDFNLQIEFNPKLEEIPDNFMASQSTATRSDYRYYTNVITIPASIKNVGGNFLCNFGDRTTITTIAILCNMSSFINPDDTSFTRQRLSSAYAWKIKGVKINDFWAIFPNITSGGSSTPKRYTVQAED